MPNSSPTTAADLPLCSQLVTASRLKVSSNFRRSRTDVCFMGFVFHCSPNSLSVNSKQPQLVQLLSYTNLPTVSVAFSHLRKDITLDEVTPLMTNSLPMARMMALGILGQMSDKRAVE